MGTLPLSFEQESPPSLSYLFSTNHGSIPRNQIYSLLDCQARHRRKMGKIGRPCYRNLWFHLGQGYRLPLSSTTNIAVSMLVMRILILTSLMSLIPSSVSTMVLLLTSSTPLTWTPPKSPPTLNPMSPFTLAESVSAAPSKDSVFPPESPSNNVSMLRLS